MMKPGLSKRPFWMILPLIFALLPFSEGLHYQQATGTGTDFVTTTWAMWWFQQEWYNAAWGGFSNLFNFPRGGQGAILSPINATFWAITDSIFGPNWASLYTSIFASLSSMIAVMWVGRGYRFSYLTCGCMALAFSIPRYFFFTIGETGVVGIAIVPLILGWGCLIRYHETANEQRTWGWFFVLCVMLQGWENPYLAPFLPLISLFFIRDYQHLWKYVFGGCIALAGVAFLYHGASAGNYESIKASSYTTFANMYFPIIERPWAKISVGDFFRMKAVMWPVGSMDSIHMSGREGLGWSVLLFAILGVVVSRQSKNMRIALTLTIIGIVFATGSTWFGTTSPFGLFNSICEKIVRPLTQPTRFLLLSIISLPVLVGCFVHALEDKYKAETTQWYRFGGVFVYVILLGESLYWGGFSMRIPTTPIPESSCVRELSHKEGAVLVWPWDGIDDERKDATLKSRWLQIAHERPAATIGTGSWPLVDTFFPGHHLRELGWKDLTQGKGDLDIATLHQQGFRWIVVDTKSPTMPTTRGKEFFVHGKQSECDNYIIYDMSQVLSSMQQK